MCDICKRSKFQHTVVYYSNRTFVKVSTDIVKVSSLLVETQTTEKLDELLGKKKNSIKESLSQNNLMQKSTNEPLNTASSMKNAKKLLENFKEEENREYLNIQNHIECEGCGERLTKSVRLSQNFLEYSFLRFLMHFFTN
jgi:hypothetical protein